MMKKVVEVFYDDVLASRLFTTGIVYKLESGEYVVSAQDGYVQPNQLYSEETLNELREKTEIERGKDESVS